jgi:RimJ/RimL family protein N-acetyltransferase
VGDGAVPGPGADPAAGSAGDPAAGAAPEAVTEPVPGATTDGVVTLRPPVAGDAAVLVAGRDAEARRWFGPGDPEPAPTACVVVDGRIVGWVDADADQAWLGPGEVNVGYGLFAVHRGQGHATRAVHLLLHRLALAGAAHSATLLIAPRNRRSLAVARRTGFARAGSIASVPGELCFRRPVPPLWYGDGVVRIRRQRASDVDMHLAGIDDQQIDWLWLPGQRRLWEAMTPEEQRAHTLAGLVANRRAFGRGPKWVFSVDDVARGIDYVAYVDANLANDSVPRGEANIAYSVHPDHRGRGLVTRAVRLLLRFLGDHTGARRAHIVVDDRNIPSLRVAAAVGARPVDRWTSPHGAPMTRHVLAVPR